MEAYIEHADEQQKVGAHEFFAPGQTIHLRDIKPSKKRKRTNWKKKYQELSKKHQKTLQKVKELKATLEEFSNIQLHTASFAQQQEQSSTTMKPLKEEYHEKKRLPVCVPMSDADLDELLSMIKQAPQYQEALDLQRNNWLMIKESK